MSQFRKFAREALEEILKAVESGDSTAMEDALEALVKSYEEPAEHVNIAKLDLDRQMVWGWASVATKRGVPVQDWQGDIVDILEVSKAAHDFMINQRMGGTMHKRMGTGTIVESIIFDKALQDALRIDLGQEGWFIGVQVADKDTWEGVKSGKYAAFSIGGSGVREALPH